MAEMVREKIGQNYAFTISGKGEERCPASVEEGPACEEWKQVFFYLIPDDFAALQRESPDFATDVAPV